MFQFAIRRILLLIPTLAAIAVGTFLIIQAPPGDYVDYLAAHNPEDADNPAYLAMLRERYGLGEPMYMQFWIWFSNIIFHGDFGHSFRFNAPVAEVVGQRLPLTLALALLTLVFTWAMALPIGIFAAVRQYSIGDYVATTIGFLGLSIPNFMLALVFVWVSFRYFGQSAGGLFSPEYVDAQWSLARFWDLLSHLWVPVVVIGTAGTAGLIRIMRANLLDELRKPYVVTARSKGISERRLLIKYPVRMAANPFFSTIGWVLPGIVSGEVIVSMVLNLQTTGPLLLDALRSQDMFLAGSFIMILATLTVLGTMLSDFLLAWLDPRIRKQYR